MSSARNHAKRSHRSERTHHISCARSAGRLYAGLRAGLRGKSYNPTLFRKLAKWLSRKSETKTNNKGD